MVRADFLAHYDDVMTSFFYCVASDPLQFNDVLPVLHHLTIIHTDIFGAIFQLSFSPIHQ